MHKGEMSVHIFLFGQIVYRILEFLTLLFEDYLVWEGRGDEDWWLVEGVYGISGSGTGGHFISASRNW